MTDLNDEDPFVRMAALTHLWGEGDAEDADALLVRLQQETDAELLEMVIDTLSALECISAGPALRALGHDLTRPPQIRRAAITAANELSALAS